MRIMSFNIDSGIGTDLEFMPERSLEVIRNASPDAAALQEVAICRPNRPPVNYPELAGSSLGLHSAYGNTLDFDNGGQFGNAVLSRYRIEPMEILPLPVPSGAEPRAALIVKVLAEKIFYLISLHLPFQGEFPDDDSVRKKQLAILQKHVEEKSYFPALLAGDLNNGEHSPAVCFLREKWDIANDLGEGLPTAKTGKFGWMQIDFICGYPKGAWIFRRFERIDALGASDHYPIIVEVEFV